MKLKNSLFLLSLTLVIGCKSDDNPVSPDSFDSYLPLQIGNEWSFEFPWWTPASGDTMVTVNYKIIAKKQVNGKEYYAFNYPMPFFPSKYDWIIETIDTVFVRQNENGDIMLLVEDAEWTYFTFNKAMLDTLIRSKIGGMDYYYQIQSNNDTVNTRVGSFSKCYKILNYFPAIVGTEHYIWLAPGYGPVKIYYPELDVTYQLVSINIVKSN